MNQNITPGIYKHFKGKYYKVLFTALHTETNEEFIIYQAMYGNQEIFARPVSMFLSKVDKEKYPNSKQEYRFEKISPNVKIIDVYNIIDKYKDFVEFNNRPEFDQGVETGVLKIIMELEDSEEIVNK